MKRIKAAGAATAFVAAVALVASAGVATAEPGLPQPGDLVGVGSDTTQFLVSYLADGTRPGGAGPYVSGYNNTTSKRIASFDAFKPGTGPGTGIPLVTGDTIAIRINGQTITRPNGSGQGKGRLFGSTNDTKVNFARSSSPNSAAETSAGLQAFPYAVDGLKMVTSGQVATHAPAALTINDIRAIYTGTATQWNQLPDNPTASTATIHAYIPQSGSGTRKYFAQLVNGSASETDPTWNSIVKDVAVSDPSQKIEEHDPTWIQGDPDAIAPFSVARANTLPNPGVIVQTGGFSAQRAVYNVVRSSDLGASWVSSAFGSGGFFCSDTARPLIVAAGFQQLARPANGGACGVPTQAAFPGETNLTVNAG